MSKIYLDVLSKKQQEFFVKLAAFQKFGYLAGGTALALQINHRISVDFDIFTSQPISYSLRSEVKRIFGAQQYEVNSSDQITFSPATGIAMTFVWYYYTPVKPLISTH